MPSSVRKGSFVGRQISSITNLIGDPLRGFGGLGNGGLFPGSGLLDIFIRCFWLGGEVPSKIWFSKEIKSMLYFKNILGNRRFVKSNCKWLSIPSEINWILVTEINKYWSKGHSVSLGWRFTRFWKWFSGTEVSCTKILQKQLCSLDTKIVWFDTDGLFS